MFGCKAAGAFVGAAGGAIGAGIANTGWYACNTAAVAASSTFNSVGAYYMNGEKGKITTSFGIASLTWNKNGAEFNFVGRKGNSTAENIMFGIGGLAQVADVVQEFRYARMNRELKEYVQSDKELNSILNRSGKNATSIRIYRGWRRAFSTNEIWGSGVEGGGFHDGVTWAKDCYISPKAFNDINLRYLTSGHELNHAAGRNHDYIFNWECDQLNNGRVPSICNGFDLRQNIMDHRIRNGLTLWHY